MAEPTDEEIIIEYYLELRRQGAGERQAARLIQSTYREVAAWFEANPVYKAQLDDALAERLERAEHKAWQAAQDGDPAMLKLTLESHAPVEWTKPSPEMILKVQQDVGALTEDEVGALLERLTAARRRQELSAGAIEVEGEDTTDVVD